jgi:hypothetical protein
MKKLLLLAAAAAALTTFTPEPADAQGMRRGGGVRGPAVARRGVVVARPGVRYGYRPGYVRRGRGWAPAAVGLGVLGAAAVGAAAAGAYGYDPCVRRQPIYDSWGNPVGSQLVNVC